MKKFESLFFVVVHLQQSKWWGQKMIPVKLSTIPKILGLTVIFRFWRHTNIITNRKLQMSAKYLTSYFSTALSYTGCGRYVSFS